MEGKEKDTAPLDFRGAGSKNDQARRLGKKRTGTGIYRFWSFCLPILLLVPVLFYLGILPFGNSTSLAVDLRYQYIGFLEGLRHAMETGDGFFYNMTKGLGGGMAGTFAYYLMSPLNFLIPLFSHEGLPILVLISQLAKVGFAGFAFSCLLISKEEGRDFKVVVFSTLYALSAFILANFINPFWLDPIAIFPLVILFQEKLLDGDNPLPYMIFLALMVMTNFYIGLMACFFLLLFSIYYLIRRPKPETMTHGQWFGQSFKRFWQFVLFSVIGLAITSLVVLPGLYSILHAQGVPRLDLTDFWSFLYHPRDFFLKLLPGTFNYGEVPEGLPNIFTGTLCTLGVIYYVFNGKVPFREKLPAILILAFLCLSMTTQGLNRVWHGMEKPIWYNFRFSWLFSFFIALLSFRSFNRMEGLPIFGTVIALLATGYLAYYAYLRLGDVPFLNLYNVIIFAGMVLALVITIGLSHRSDGSRRMGAFSLACILTCLELVFNSGVTLSSFDYEDLTHFRTYDLAVREAVDPIRPNYQEGEFWRVNQTFFHDSNDGMRFNIPNLSHFNAGLEGDAISLMSSLGFVSTQKSYTGTNSTRLTDALFGVRYYLQAKDLGNQEGVNAFFQDQSMRPDLEDMEEVADYKKIQVYENKEVMPILLLAESTVKDLDPGRMNPIDFQNDLLNQVDGQSQGRDYFHREPVKLVDVNGLSTSNEGPITRYERIRAGQDRPASLEYQFKTFQGRPYYLTVSNTLNKINTRLYLDGDLVPNKRVTSNANSQVYNVAGAASPGQTHTLRVELNEGEDYLDINNISLFSLNMKGLKKAVAFQEDQGFRLTRMNDRRIEGVVETDQENNYLLAPLPYDRGWSIQVDGKKMSPSQLLGGFLGVPLSPGSHKIVWNYQPPYIKEAAYISAGSLVLAVVVGIVFQVQSSKKRKDG